MRFRKKFNVLGVVEEQTSRFLVVSLLNLRFAIFIQMVQHFKHSTWQAKKPDLCAKLNVA